MLGRMISRTAFHKLSRSAQRPGQEDEPEQLDPQHDHGSRGDSGLTTLEWLLIVAAVAGLAALAVVLVQRVVGDTSEEIAGQSARETAAKVAATRITDSARAEGLVTGADVNAVNDKYRRECNRLRVLYSDAGITTEYTPGVESGGAWDTDPLCDVSETGGTSATGPGAIATVTYNPASGVLTWSAASGTGVTYGIDCSGMACPSGWSEVTGLTVTTYSVGVPGSTTNGETATFTVTATNSGGSTTQSDTHTVS